VRQTWSGVALLGLLLVGGCQKPDEQLDQAERSIHSWYAALSLTDTQLTRGQIPPVYAPQLVDAADKSLDEQSETIKKCKSTDASRKTRLVDTIAFVRGQGQRLRHLAESRVEGPS